MNRIGVGVTLAPNLAAAEHEIVGMYLAKGLNADGSEYRGLVHIVQRGESFVVSWTSLKMSAEVVVLKPVWVGLGILSEGMLAVSYFSPDTAGVAVYRIEENGHRLAARFTAAGEDGAVHSETLTRLPDDESGPESESDLSEPSNQRSAPAAPPARKTRARGDPTRAL
jgi:hypothetical protein